MKKEIVSTKSESFFISLNLFLILTFLLILFYFLTLREIRETSKKGNEIVHAVFLSVLENSIPDIKFLSRFEDESKFTTFMEIHKKYSQLRILSDKGMEVFRINKNKDSVNKVQDDQLQSKKHRYYFQEAEKTPNDKVYVSPIDFNVEKNVVFKNEPTFRIIKKLQSNRFLVLNVSPDYLQKEIGYSNQYKFSIEKPDIKEFGFLSLLRGKASMRVNFKQSDFNNENVVVSPWNLWIIFDLKSQRVVVFSIFLSIFFLILGLFFLRSNIQKREQKFQQIYQLFTDMVMESALFTTTDEKGVITYVNKNFEKTSGYTLEEVKGKTHAVLNSSYHPKGFFKNLWAVISQGEIWTGVIKNKAKDGSYYWVNTIITPLKNSLNEIEGYASLRFDITNEKRLEERNNSLRSQNIKGINMMSAHLAHQFATPLGIIQTSKDILHHLIHNHPEQEKDIKSQLGNIQNALQSMQEITSFIKLLGKRSTTEPNPDSYCHLRTVIENSLHLSKNAIEGERITVNWDPSKFDYSVRGHHTLLMQVILNLLKNSSSALKGKLQKVITLDALPSVESVKIIYRDSGGGINQDIIEQMFTPFYTTKSLNEGTGLGLSFAREVLSYSGGNICYSGNEQLTEFELSFTLKGNSKETTS